MKTLFTLLLSLTVVALMVGWSAGESTDIPSAPPPEVLTPVPAVSPGMLVAIRELTLKEGVDSKVFEKFITDEFIPTMRRHVPGAKALVVRGERGKHVGKYLYLWVFDSMHIRNLYFPGPDQPSKVWQAVAEASGGAIEQMLNRMDEYAEGTDEYTDYVAIE